MMRNIKKEFTNKNLIMGSWIGFLSVIIIILAVIVNNNLGNRQFKIEMQEHWPGAQPQPVHKPVQVNFQGALTAIEQSYNDIAQELNKVSVCISGGKVVNGVPQQINATGIIVGNQYVLTNYHVIENATHLYVIARTPAIVSVPAEVIRTDWNNDIALLKINTTAVLPIARIGNSDTVNAGDIVFAVGNALGSGNVFTSGMVCDRNQSFTINGRNYQNMIRTETYMFPGSSGGPLANIRGEVIGINTAIYDPNGNFTGISFVTPINRALKLIQSWNLPGINTFGGQYVQVAYSPVDNPYSLAA
ncbi:MAG: trypsin-like peptidase domain-containing protein [Candidatus Omnitrophica bacterium]|nr:trypsin-like peptidase domain-containing protein [Candidatus Omnitrophota bacterium]